MRVALVNPHWDFARSIYFGCRSPHLPLELGYAKALLEAAGHDVLMLDGHLNDTPNAALADAVADFAPGMTVVTTAPSYLFCAALHPNSRCRATFSSISGAAAAAPSRSARTVP